MRVILYDKKDGPMVADLNATAVHEVTKVRGVHLRGVIKQWRKDYRIELPGSDLPESVL